MECWNIGILPVVPLFQIHHGFDRSSGKHFTFRIPCLPAGRRILNALCIPLVFMVPVASIVMMPIIPIVMVPVTPIAMAIIPVVINKTPGQG